MSERECEWLFPAAPSLSDGTNHPPPFQLLYLFDLLAHSLTLSHSLTSCVSPISFLSFLYFSLLFENSSYSFEAYFLCVAGCGEEVGLGGCGLLSCACVSERETEREREERGRVIQPYDLIHSSFWLESDRERESESYSLGRVYALSQI